jgi:hypothetical protein
MDQTIVSKQSPYKSKKVEQPSLSTLLAEDLDRSYVEIRNKTQK